MTLQTMTTTPPHTSADAEPAAEDIEAIDAALDIRGCLLDDQETAAVVAVLARLAAAEPVNSDAGGTGPADRTMQRHQRMLLDQHGIWGQPGSWLAAGGMR